MMPVLSIFSLLGKLMLRHSYLGLFLQVRVKLRVKFCQVCRGNQSALVSWFLFTDALYLWGKKQKEKKTNPEPNKAYYNYLSRSPQ